MVRCRLLMVRGWLVAFVVAAMLLSGAPAGAHGRLPVGKYECYLFDGYAWVYSYFDLYIRRNNRYVLKLGADRVGAAGRFTHAASGERLRFRSGYLAEEGYKGAHKRSSGGAHTISMVKKTNLGTMEYSCS